MYFLNHQKVRKKWGANRPNEKLRFSIFWVFRDVTIMCYAVGIYLIFALATSQVNLQVAISNITQFPRGN